MSSYDVRGSPTIRCSGKESCHGMTADGTENPSPFDGTSALIYCFAETSCASMEMVVGSSSTMCAGDHSCMDARITSTFLVQCQGQNSCQGAEIVGKDLYCYADRACRGASVDLTEDLYLEGHESGMDATLSAPRIYVRGYRALSGSVIDSQDGDIVVDMEAHMAGDGATLVCRAGSECSITCHGTSCKNMNIECENDAVCNVFPEGCTSGGMVDGTDCPKYVETASIADESVLAVLLHGGRDAQPSLLICAGVLMVVGAALFSCKVSKQKEYETIN